MTHSRMWQVAAITIGLATIELTGIRTQAQSAGPAGRDLVNQAIAAMGGEARLTSLHSLALEAIGHGFALEQSERPEGPWLTTYTQTSEVRDFDRKRIWLQSQRRNWSFPQWSPAQISIAGDDASAVQANGRWFPTPPSNMDAALALEPERILLTARAAADLRAMPDELQQKINQHVVAFTYQNKAMRLLFNPWTYLPTMFEQISNDRWNVWGDVTERRWYSFWTLEKGGLLYPRQTTTEWNGFPFGDRTVQGLTVDAPIDETKFAVPDDVKAASKAGTSPTARPAPTPAIDESKVVAVSDSVVELSGGYNVTLVTQPDGIVVIEATTSPAYSELVLGYIAKRYPNTPIKALITTSDAWPHIGGVREYVARGIPIYALDLNVAILSRVVASPHTLAPDTLAKTPKPPVFKPVTEKTVVGSGDTRLELVPFRGEIGERMMAVWLPGQHLLYSSDAIQRASGGKPGFFMPSMLLEVAAALDREHITGVDKVFGMHLAPTAWSEVVAAIQAAK